MINLFRKNQRVLMLAVAILTIIAFVLLYNTAQLDEIASARNPSIYGRVLTPGMLDRQVKNFQLTAALGQFELIAQLSGGAEDRQQALNEFVWNLLVLQHQSKVLGVQPTDDQVASRIEQLPVLQTNGQFDPVKYATFLREQLTPRGFTERQLEEVVRDTLRLERMVAIVGAPAAVSDAELTEAARIFQPVTAVVLKVDPAAIGQDVPVSDADVTTYFERNRDALRSEEQRTLRYVTFALPDGQNLEGREKVDAMQKLAGQATAFADALAAPGADFEGTAKASGLVVKTLPAVNRSGQLPDAEPAVAAVADVLAPAVFILPEAGAATDVLQVGDTFYVAQLTGVQPSRPLTLEEAAPMIRARLGEFTRERMVSELGASKARAVADAMKSGKSITDAATAAGLLTERVEAVVPAAEETAPEQRMVLASTLGLREGELSPVERGVSGPFFVYLEKRGPIDEKAFAERRAELRDGILEGKQRLLFADWLRVARSAANIQIPQPARG